MSINRADWSKDRIRAFISYLKGDKDAKFTGKLRGGGKGKPTSVEKLISFYEPKFKFSTNKNALWVQDETFGKRRVLNDDQVSNFAERLFNNKYVFKNKKDDWTDNEFKVGLGRAPSIYNYMKTKYVNVSYKKVETAIKKQPMYQKYQARHLAKPKTRNIIITKAVGDALDTDLMTMWKTWFRAKDNEGFSGLVVVVDRLSGHISIDPLLKPRGNQKNWGADVVARKVVNIINALKRKVPGRFKNGTIFHDNGVEFRGEFADKMKTVGYGDVVVSLTAGAPSAHAERAIGILRGLINTKLSVKGKTPRKVPMTATKRRPWGLKGAQSWWPLVRALVKSYNETPMTDARAPYSPNQIMVMRGKDLKSIINRMESAGSKRVSKVGKVIEQMATVSTYKDGKKTDTTRKMKVRVSKRLKVLKVGDWVRFAIEHVRKTGADKRPYPKQRWSSKTYRVKTVKPTPLGFGKYILERLPRRRFEREDLQFLRRGGGAVFGDDSSDEAEAMRGSRRTRHSDPI